MAGLIPKYVDQVNSLVRWWENPCDAPWTVYAELAKEPAGNVLLALMAFGMDDVARGMFRPKGVRGGRHGRRGPRGGRRRPGIPELGEMIGKRMPGAEELRGREVTDGVKKLWMIDGVIQRGLWYWLLADVTLGFFAEWLSAVQESEFCRTMAIGAAAFEATPVAAAIQGWRAFPVTKLYERGTVHLGGSPALHTSGFGWSEGTCTVTFAADGAKVPLTSGDPKLEWRLNDGQHIIASGSASLSKTEPGKQGAVSSPIRVRTGGAVVIEIRAIPSGFFQCEQALGVAVQTLGDLP